MMMLLVTIDFTGDIERLRHQLETAFRMPVNISEYELDSPPFLDRRRNQYNSSAIIGQLKKDLATLDLKVLAVTSLDLFIHILTFVFGEAHLNGKCAVVSSYRLSSRFYGLPENPGLLRERLFREAVHELGHTFGLLHCQNPECVMKSSTYVEEIDFKSSRFFGRRLDKLPK